MLTLTLPLTALAGPCPTSTVPGETWGDGTEAVREAAPDAVAALEAYAFPDTIDEEERTGVRTDGLVITRDGEVLYERYGRDWTAEKPHLQWSASKSVTNTLFAMAVADGLIGLDDSICDVLDVPEAACAVTPRHLIEFSSGFAWRESYEGQSPTASSVIAMLFGEGRADMAAFVAGHALRDPPGTSYMYSSGDTNLLSAVTHAVLEPQDGPRYPWTRLFEPIGITSAVFERDQQGVPIGSSYLYLTPRDMARYGTLLLNDGCWDDERLVPDGWIARAREPVSSLQGRLVDRDEDEVPGWNVWLNRPVPGIGPDAPPFEGAPVAMFAPMGHWRQAIYVLPTHGIVVARTGDDRDGESYQHGELLARVVDLVEALEAAEAGSSRATEAPDEMGPTDGSEAAGDAPEEVDAAPATPDQVGRTDDPETAAGPEDAPASGADAPSMPVPADPAARWRQSETPEAVDGTPFAEPPKKYDLGLLRIASGYAARQACSCLFVSGRSEEACRAYIKVKPDVARIRIDWEARTVRARSLGFAKVVARHVGTEEGCVVED